MLDIDVVQLREIDTELKELWTHRHLAKELKDAYERDIQDTYERHTVATIVVDYKENYKTGHSSVETDERSYSQFLKTVFSFSC